MELWVSMPKRDLYRKICPHLFASSAIFFLLKERANSYVLRQLNKLLVFFLLFRQVAAGSQNQAGDPAVEGKSPSADQVAT